MNNYFKKNRGFTLVELLVSISIMSLLLAISISTYQFSIEKTKYSKALSDLKVILLIFENFGEDNEDLPPVGEDHCDACALNEYYVSYTRGTWQEIVDIIKNANYPFKVPLNDPWGTPYAYDKNFMQECTNAWSILCSAGPNKTLETDICQIPPSTVTSGDDICIWLPDND